MGKGKPKTELDERLDDALMATFPCSDPFSVRTAEDDTPPVTPDKKDGAVRPEKTPDNGGR